MNWKKKGSPHYRVGRIEPWDYIAANGLDFWEGNIVKYITRWRHKGTPVSDLDKLIHYAEYLKEVYEKEMYGTQSSKQVEQSIAPSTNIQRSWLRRLFWCFCLLTQLS